MFMYDGSGGVTAADWRILYLPSSKKPNTVQIAEALAAPVAEALGFTLWDVRFEKEGTNWYLRYFIDKSGGVNIQDCTDFSRAVDKLLDEADPIQQSYTLEVCSPGIERQLVRDHHFQQYLGYRVTVRLIRPVDGVRDFTGTLVTKTGDEIRLLLDDEEGDAVEMVFAKGEAAYVKLYADFN